jgi:hypothetical protein
MLNMPRYDTHKANEVTAAAGDTPLEANAGELEGGALAGGGLAGSNLRSGLPGTAVETASAAAGAADAAPYAQATPGGAAATESGAVAGTGLENAGAQAGDLLAGNNPSFADGLQAVSPGTAAAAQSRDGR